MKDKEDLDELDKKAKELKFILDSRKKDNIVNYDEQLNDIERKINMKLKTIVHDLTEKLEIMSNKFYEADYLSKRADERYNNYRIVNILSY